MDQWNRIGSLEKDPHKCSQLVFDKKAKAIQLNKNSLSTNGPGTSGHPHAKKIYKKIKKNLDTDLIPFIRINSKWIMDLNAKCKILKPLEDDIGENL